MKIDSRHELIKVQEHTHPQDCSKLFLVQVAVDEIPCIPFWSHVAQRIELGEEAWLKSLADNADDMIAKYGRAPALV